MSHIVIYRSPDGKPGYHQLDDLSDAISYVESLRNDQGVQDSRIYRLEQVGFRFETYYHVRVDGEANPPPPIPEAPSSWSPAVVAPQPAQAPPPVAQSPAALRPVEAAVPPLRPEAVPTLDSDASDERAAELTDVDSNGVRRGLFGR